MSQRARRRCRASDSMMPRVSSAAAWLMSTRNTAAPWRASNVAVALPLPQPGPTEPAPVTIATFPAMLSIGAFPSLVAGSVYRACGQGELARTASAWWLWATAGEGPGSARLVGVRGFEPPAPASRTEILHAVIRSDLGKATRSAAHPHARDRQCLALMPDPVCSHTVLTRRAAEHPARSSRRFPARPSSDHASPGGSPRIPGWCQRSEPAAARCPPSPPVRP